MSDLPTIVVADDSATVRKLVCRILSHAGFHVVEAADGIDALAAILTTRPQLAVLDQEMPGCSGMEVLRRVRAEPSTAHVAVLMLTATDDRSAAARALGAGAVDFVRKPCEPAELVARVRKAAAARALLDDLDRRSSTDPLTGLPNRRGIEPVLQTLAGGVGSATAVLVVDVDHFKAVNDTLGHDVGDRVLCTVAGRLAAAAMPLTVARWGGEEFVAVGRCSGRSELAEIAERLRRAVAVLPCEVEVDGSLHALSVTVSVGALLVPDGASVPEALVDADAALYAAKERGRDRVVVVGPCGLEDVPQAASVADGSGARAGSVPPAWTSSTH